MIQCLAFSCTILSKKYWHDEEDEWNVDVEYHDATDYRSDSADSKSGDVKSGIVSFLNWIYVRHNTFLSRQ